MSVNEFDSPLEALAQCKFKTSTVPKPHSAFETYVFQITAISGLSWIKAIGTTVVTSSYGVELKSTFDSMEQKLASAYGRQKKYDFLMHESIWNEPRDWMQSLLNKERVLMSEWNRETGANLADSLSSVALILSVIDSSSGYVTIEYTFENNAAAEKEISALEDDAL